MAILGLGTDIVEIARIEAVIARSGDRLARRVLSDHEWSIWEQHQQPVRFLAKRFAVKEAAAKYHANLNAPKNPPRQKTSDEFETDGDAF